MPNNKKNNCNISNKLNKNKTLKKCKIKDPKENTPKYNKPKAIKSPLKKRFSFNIYNNLIIKPEIIKTTPEFTNKYKTYLSNATNCETDNYIIKLISAYSYVPIINIITKNINIAQSTFSNNIKTKEKCPICIENINKNKLVFFKCGHYMCFNCLTKFLNFNYPSCCCPICKEKNIENNIVSFYNNYIREYLFLPDIKTYYTLSNINKWFSDITLNNSIYILISNYEKWTKSISNYINFLNSNSNSNSNSNVIIICLNYNDFLIKNNNKRSHTRYFSNSKIIENKILNSKKYNNTINNVNYNDKENKINVNIHLIDPIIKHISTKKKILISIQNNIKNLKEIKYSSKKNLFKINNIKQYIIKDTIDEKIFREEVIFL